MTGDRVHVRRGTLAAAPDIPGADDDADFHAHVMHAADDFCHAVHLVKIKKIMIRLQRLAAELQQYPMIYRHDARLLSE